MNFFFHHRGNIVASDSQNYVSIMYLQILGHYNGITNIKVLKFTFWGISSDPLSFALYFQNTCLTDFYCKKYY